MSITTIQTLPGTLREALVTSRIWSEGCPVPLDRLSLVTMKYVDFAQNEHADGELVVLDVVAEHAAEVFAELYRQRFPINKVRSLHEYGGNDDLAMADNNTSAFNFRVIMGTSVVSIHSYGLAIDLNPLQNPMVTFDGEPVKATVHPADGWQNLNRNIRKPGMVEELVPLFAEHGFFCWGGDWTTPIDYHHFQAPRGVAELLMLMDYDDGKRFFQSCIEARHALGQMPAGESLSPLIDLYKSNRAEFFNKFLDYLQCRGDA